MSSLFVHVQNFKFFKYKVGIWKIHNEIRTVLNLERLITHFPSHFSNFLLSNDIKVKRAKASSEVKHRKSTIVKFMEKLI